LKEKSEFGNNKIALLASKTSGWNIYNVLNSLSQAYILTGDEKYFVTAKNWMLEISKWDPNGPSHASQFYKLWISQVESHSSSMHVWQHINHRVFQTSLAFIGKVPEADLWLEYIYELWIAQAPKMGENDGSWFNGTGYFRMNTLTIYDVTANFKEMSGVDFMWTDWYKNNSRWLIYAIPPNSVADGFCNDGNKHPVPTINYAGYSDTTACMFNNPYASWYANDGAYGWILRFLHGKQISYAVGAATNAYSGNDEGKYIDLGMKLFRRHYIMLRPSIIVIYDELDTQLETGI